LILNFLLPPLKGVNKGDYVTIANSEVYDNTWWSSSAESAVVLAESVNIDKVNGIKMKLTGNTVYGNINKIPYYNPSYTWDYSPIGGLNCSSYGACKLRRLMDVPGSVGMERRHKVSFDWCVHLVSFFT